MNHGDTFIFTIHHLIGKYVHIMETTTKNISFFSNDKLQTNNKL